MPAPGFGGGGDMETRVAIIGVIVEEPEAVERLNMILHEYSYAIIGRMGLPYHKKGVSIISVAVDAPQSVTSALSGKLGRLKGVTVKTAYGSI
ncbi:iron-only hydrogenase system regulator [Deltaproteobacteria bacterium OttesenSCG-928-K17]|nr:iron-only hydrogenase system regulator [Deltaproteobacteria bacterium OttesenSCG-928-K17]